MLLLLLLFTPWEFFTSALANGLSLEFKWQQISSSLQDSSQYSGHSQQYYSLDGLHSSANFQVPSSFNSTLVTVPNAPITIDVIVTFMFHSFFQLPSKVEGGTYPSFHFLFVLFCGQPGQQRQQFWKFFYYYYYYYFHSSQVFHIRFKLLNRTTANPLRSPGL